MKRVGVIGGIGPESTIAYYRQIIAASRRLGVGDGYPPVLINSIDLQKVLGLVAANDLAQLTDYLVGEVESLARGGAELALLAANTPHIVFDDVQRRSSIPMVSIVEATCDAVLALGVRRVALLGTRFTMQGRFYPAVFSRAGIAVVAPRDDEQDYVHRKYVEELLNGVFDATTRDGLRRIVAALKERESVEAVILAGTELPLVLTDTTASGIPLLDTTPIHVQAAAEQLWGAKP